MGGYVVLPCHGAVAGIREAAPRVVAERLVDIHSQLRAVDTRLLEVITDDLVELDELGAVLLDPAREALVQVGARRLG
jgi:hypothetical protein